MWPDVFEHRLLAWQNLRRSAQDLSPRARYLAVNDWWWQVPPRARDILWENTQDWPDPWQLLDRSTLSDLGRALAMSYTIIMIQPNIAADLEMVFTGHDNLVLIAQGKYILNWSPGKLLNIRSHPMHRIKTLCGTHIKSRIGGI